MQTLRFITLGEGLIFRAVNEALEQSGHTVVARLSTSSGVERTPGYTDVVSSKDVDDILTHIPCDVLLSVANQFVLQPTTLTRPNVAAINYHNSPLPAYAGLRATAWAIANGESMYGVTWHLIEDAIDTGAVLVQRTFALATDETTASLDARCATEALAGFDELLALLSGGHLTGYKQDGAARSYYGRRDIVPSAGILDFSRSVRDIVQLVRACNWGAGANDFGATKVVLDHAPPALVLDAGAAPLNRGDTIGMVLRADGATACIACSDGVVRLTLDRVFDMPVGAVLPIARHDAAAAEIAAYERSLLHERHDLTLYQAAASSTPDVTQGSGSGAIPTAGDLGAFLQAISRVLGRGTICAVEADGGALALRHDWQPFRAVDGVADGALPPCRDIHLRRPSLKGLEQWPRSALIRILLGDVLGDLPPDTIAFGRDGTIHYRHAEATAKALAHAMIPVEPPGVLGDRHDTVPLRILATARARPEAIAIKEGRDTTTYAALAQQAQAIAGRLKVAGIQCDDGIGVLLPPGAAFVAAALGAMLAGGAYVPLDPLSPALRLLAEVDGAGITHVITSRELTALPAQAASVVLIEDVVGTEAGEMRTLSPQACAYRIFTSGSTGRPKAVDITHTALANLVEHCCSALPLGADDRMTMLARPTFDASVADIWPILTVGGMLLVPPAGILLDQPRLLDWLSVEHATCAFVPTAIAERLLRMPQPPGIALHTLLTGGDTLRHRPPIGLPYRLINSYGPTENTVASLWSIVAPGPRPPTIGQPIAGVTVQVVDAAGQAVPDGEIGELLLGGDQVARGYHGRPELTAQRFVVGANDQRFYRTGDRVRMDAYGEYEFHGRTDDQLQVLGIRVEPGEIEAVLLSDSRVAEAACLPWRSGGQVGGLIAFIVLRDPGGERTSLTAGLRTMLAERLPAALVPRDLRIEAALPYRTSGKIDRDALAKRIVNDDPATDDALGHAWRRALPLAGDVETGNFWENGGDSLAAITLLTELETLTGVSVSTGSFLAHPTLMGLRRLLDALPSSSAIEMRAGRSPVIVCWYGVTGDLEAYQHLIAHLPDRRIIGITSPGLRDAGKLPSSVEQAAASGLLDLERLVEDEPLVLLGFSFGGLLAFEAARQLAARGRAPLLVGLLGSRPPAKPLGKWARRAYLGRRLPRYAWRILSGKQRVRLPWRAIPGEMLRVLGLRASLPVLPGWVRDTIVQVHFRMSERYTPQMSALTVHLVRELHEKNEISLRHYLHHERNDLGWGEWNNHPITVHWVDAHHANVMSDAASEVGEILDQQIDLAMAHERSTSMCPAKRGHANAPLLFPRSE